jgi:hypothetical protein
MEQWRDHSRINRLTINVYETPIVRYQVRYRLIVGQGRGGEAAIVLDILQPERRAYALIADLLPITQERDIGCHLKRTIGTRENGMSPRRVRMLNDLSRRPETNEQIPDEHVDVEPL